MDPTQLVATLAGATAIAGIVWSFWLKKDAGTRAAVTSGGYQEATILVKAGYTPNVIVVERGRPVRLTFRREETAVCGDMVLFPDFSKSAELPEEKRAAVEPTPSEPGEYEFACQMGMLRGKLVVE